jgi:hypothetical protein
MVSSCRSLFIHLSVSFPFLLHRHGLGQVAREVHVQALQDSQPIGNQLQRDDIEDALQNVDGLGDLNLLGLRGLEPDVAGVADDNGLAATSDDWVC